MDEYMKTFMKKVKTPLGIGFILLMIAAILGALVIIFQKVFLQMFYSLDIYGDLVPEKRVIPYGSIVTIVITFLLFFSYYLVIITGAKNKKVVAIVFIVASVILRLVLYFVSLIIIRVYAGQSEVNYVIYNAVNSAVSVITSPFILIANILYFISLGRYSVADYFEASYRLNEPSEPQVQEVE